MLSPEQVAFYQEHGFLHLPEVFNAEEIDALDRDLEQLVSEWAMTSPGWSGPWRRAYMDEATEKSSKLTAMHDLHLYSRAWMHAVTYPSLTTAVAQLIGPNVELHHSTMHIKPHIYIGIRHLINFSNLSGCRQSINRASVSLLASRLNQP